ncbi:MAG: extracellular solute-binding protein [bacterium]|nr:extracellular solute-binding protein [bacterium]
MNKAQLIIFGVVGVLVLVVILVIFGVIPGLKPSIPAKFTLTVWGFEDNDIWEEAAKKYHIKYPYITIEYVQKNHATYESDLLNALATGSGPDIFVLNNTQVTKHKEKILPLPQDALSFHVRDFKNTFFDAASGDLITKDGNILGVPLTVETLALFYNRDFLNSANIVSPPKTWEELVDAVKKLTTYTEVGTIMRSGAALGTSQNVAHSFDILGALFLQSGVEPINRDTELSGLRAERIQFGIQGSAESVLDFYTSFANSTKRAYAWSSFFPDSLTAFAQGKTALMVGYPSDYPVILEKNPHLNFDVSALPQLENIGATTHYAWYDFETVSKQSKHSEDAWNFLLWLSDSANDKAFADALNLPSARRDLVLSRPPKDYLQVFYDQILSSKTWLISDQDKLRPIFNEMIDSVVNKTASVESAVGRANERINNLFLPEK